MKRNKSYWVFQALFIGLMFSLLIGCSTSPSENTVSSLVKEYVEKGGNNKLNSLQVISIKENKLFTKFNEQIFGGSKAYTVEVDFSFDVIKDVNPNQFVTIYRKGDHLNCKGSFTTSKRDGKWVMENIFFDKLIY